MICNERGQMVVGQFGSYLAEVIERLRRSSPTGDVVLLNDPYICKGSISHCNDWLVVLPIFHEGVHVGFSSIFGHMMDVGGKVPGSQSADATVDLGRGYSDPAGQDLRAGRAESGRPRHHPEQHPHPGNEPLRPDVAYRWLPGGGAARGRDLRSLRSRAVRSRMRRPARAHTQGHGPADPRIRPGGEGLVHRLGRRRRTR